MGGGRRLDAIRSDLAREREARLNQMSISEGVEEVWGGIFGFVGDFGGDGEVKGEDENRLCDVGV